MRAGQLDRRITLQRRDEEASASGEPRVVWRDVATVWAALVYGKGAERFAAQQVMSEVPVTFRIRYARAWRPTTLDRIVYDGRDYDIRDVREIGRREGYELDATVRTEEPIRGGA